MNGIFLNFYGDGITELIRVSVSEGREDCSPGNQGEGHVPTERRKKKGWGIWFTRAKSSKPDVI